MIYIGQKSVIEKGIKSVTITSEPDYEDVDFKGKVTEKMCCIVSTDIPDIKEAKWQMNQATNNWCMTQWGNDTKLWMSKTIPINVRQVGGMNPSVYPVACSLDKVIS